MYDGLSLLIKPASALCDLNCAYCFYKKIAEERGTPGGIMTGPTAERLLDRAFSLRPAALSVSFQGGEPPLAGLDWYRRFLALAAEKNADRIPVDWSIQTNGTNVDGEWAAFFKENRFLVGLSLDGDRATNDRCRRDAAGNSVYDRTLAAADTLTAYGTDFNILSVVTDESACEIDRTYRDFKRRGFRFLQFIPLVDEGTGPTLGADAYGYFLKRLFDLWYEDFCRGEYVSVRHIDNYVRMLLGQPPENCAMGGVCGRYYVIEANGDVYPCDFYCREPYRLGNVFDEAPFACGEKHRAFLADSYTIHRSCAACEYHALCRGGCRRDRTEDGTRNKYCEAYRAFFAHALPRLRRAAQSLPLRFPS